MGWDDLGECLQRIIDNGGVGGAPGGEYQPWDHPGQPGTNKSHQVLKMLRRTGGRKIERLVGLCLHT